MDTRKEEGGSRQPAGWEVPQEFRGSTYDDVMEYFNRGRMSDADLAKLRKRNKAEAMVSGISDALVGVANMIGAHNYAPAAKADPRESMSAKLKERFDKEEAERKASEEQRWNRALELGSLKAQDRRYNYGIWQDGKQALERAQQREEDTRRYNEQQQYRRERDAVADKERDYQRNYQRERDAVADKMNQQRLAMEQTRIRQELDKGYVDFNLGDGMGNVRLAPSQLNAQTVSRIYNTLPPSVRAKYAVKEYGKDTRGNPVLLEGSEKDPDIQTMLVAIGAHLGSGNANDGNEAYREATREAIRQVAGASKGAQASGKKGGYKAVGESKDKKKESGI